MRLNFKIIISQIIICRLIITRLSRSIYLLIIIKNDIPIINYSISGGDDTVKPDKHDPFILHQNWGNIKLFSTFCT
ncbi:MAG: hypothetical protein DRQ43_07405 [Gammaproteobacteria bacterium]|nr:MAG: hypothetical protein DRQ43_07405 [Gammaproteobacteria bacterium]